MSSQRTFQSVLGKFADGLGTLKTAAGYSPVKKELQITSLETLKSAAEQKNASVLSAETELQNFRNARRSISFKAKDADVNCIESRMRNIQSYIKAEIDVANPAYAKIGSIIKKLNPPKEKMEKPAEGQEAKKAKSQSEKSYQSLVGFGNDVYTIITGLGTVYNPSNTNLTPANFKAKIDELAALNASVVNAETAYNLAVQERSDVYNGANGINNIITSIKDYLASLEGGKKNAGYIAFANAIK